MSNGATVSQCSAQTGAAPRRSDRIGSANGTERNGWRGLCWCTQWKWEGQRDDSEAFRRFGARSGTGGGTRGAALPARVPSRCLIGVRAGQTTATRVGERRAARPSPLLPHAAAASLIGGRVASGYTASGRPPRVRSGRTRTSPGRAARRCEGRCVRTQRFRAAPHEK